MMGVNGKSQVRNESKGEKTNMNNRQRVKNQFRNRWKSNVKSLSSRTRGAALDRAWVLANHKFMSLHAAALFPYYIDHIAKLFGRQPVEMTLPVFGWEVFFFIVLTYVTWHLSVTIHEMGHYFVAVRAKALHEPSQSNGEVMLKRSFIGRIPWIFNMFFKIPWGRFEGIKKTILACRSQANEDVP